MRRSIFCARSAYTLIELVASLVLIAAVAVLAVELFKLSHGTMRDSNQRGDAIMRVDSLVEQLRRDVWGARAFQVNDNELRITTPTAAITWQRSGSELQRRAEGQSERTFRRLPPHHFEVRGPMLVLHFDEPGKEQHVTFISQLLVAGDAP